MKKLSLFLLGFFALSLLGTSAVSASGCFHDALSKDAHYEVITSGVRVRNVSCMYGSSVMTTLGAGTVVRVISYNPYWKQIEMSDGRAGWIGSQFATRTNQTANIPCSGITPGDYCDMTNLARCPNPSPKGVDPTWYTRVAPSVYNCSSATLPAPAPTPTPVVYTPPKPSVIAVTDSMKPKLNMMADNVNTKINNKYGSNLEGKLAHYKALVSALASVKSSAATLADLIDYLVSKFNERIALLELETVLDID